MKLGKQLFASGLARYLHSARPAVVRGRGAAGIHGTLMLRGGKCGHHSGSAVWAGLQLCLCAIFGHQDASLYLQIQGKSVRRAAAPFVSLRLVSSRTSGLATCPKRIQTPTDSSLWSCKAELAEELSRRADYEAAHPI